MEHIDGLILPNNLVRIEGPLIFLAGPIGGAPHWQDKAIEIISEGCGIYIASPSTKLRKKYIENSLPLDRITQTQLEWERFYLDYASTRGCVLFWLPTQIEPTPINPKTGFPKPYARDTRGELREFAVNKYFKINSVIGAEENFDGLNVIKRNLLEIDPKIEFHNTLEETCRQAIIKAIST